MTLPYVDNNLLRNERDDGYFAIQGRRDASATLKCGTPITGDHGRGVPFERHHMAQFVFFHLK